MLHLEFGEQIQPTHAGHMQVQQYQIDIGVQFDHSQRLGGIPGLDDLDLFADFSGEQRHHRPDGRMVVAQQ